MKTVISSDQIGHEIEEHLFPGSPMRTKSSLKAMMKATTSRCWIDTARVCVSVASKRALLVCFQALGTSMVANELPGARAAL